MAILTFLHLCSLQLRMVTNLRYTDEIVLLTTSEAELQQLVDRLDRVSRKYSSTSTRPR